MSNRLDFEDRVREDSAPGHDAADLHGVDTRGNLAVAQPGDDSVRAAVFPRFVTTMGAGAVGAIAGFAAVYLLSALKVNPLIGVAVIILLFGLALTGPKLLADARTETGRVVAVVLDSLAFGGTFGGLVVILFH